ncbi:hypothetical protein MUK70_21395 [Dyadobacter chenwenxiniae]|uniref:Uncharacterized protein n=1 Tax=Dyadobacter chenwenxiniae TaxID=2906456 RepID=A0A9X1TL17_9BACT|nr:hypothetical protein [Dyadobacter chenwenxiniae]MCF0061798.1 hypothetical protein [Dyadobacter chenwenxiniae]UON81614.1 hypothetical protein MUK70_21395 [Dyadobacter chenwenxiniae]
MNKTKPFILNFGTEVSNEGLDFSKIEYSYTKNLNVIMTTGMPAINMASLDTETLTKTGFESSDSDKDFNLKQLLDTSTGTRAFGEVSDTDQDRNTRLEILSLIDTATLTESGTEVTDTDQDL